MVLPRSYEEGVLKGSAFNNKKDWCKLMGMLQTDRDLVLYLVQSTFLNLNFMNLIEDYLD